MSRRLYMSAARRETLAARLTARDWAVIETLARVHLAQTRQLERLHFHGGTPLSNTRACRHTLERLTGERVLARLDRRIGGIRAGSDSFVYALDVAGQYLVYDRVGDPDRRVQRPWTPGAAFTRHVLLVTELYTRLVEAECRDDLELLDFDAEPTCWRRFAGPGGARQILKPDAFVRIGLGQFVDAWFVEVDRSTESSTTIERKLHLYRRYWSTGREEARRGVFPQVLFLVPDERRRQAIVDLCRRQPAETWSLYRVALFDVAVPVMSEVSP